jgi:GGDEF domain-containing protein
LGSISRGRPFAQRMLRAFLLALATAASLAAAQTGPPQYWTDASGKAALEVARSAFEGNQGRLVEPGQIMPLGGGAAVWYRLWLPDIPAPARAVFTVPVAGIDKVELFHPDGVGGWRSQQSGDSLAVDQWPVRYLYPAFVVAVQPRETQATYLRIQNSNPIRVTWELRDVRSFLEAAKVWHLALGAYGGFMVLVVLLGVANAVSWRDPIHLYYAFHVVLVGLSILSLTGLAGEYLWPANAWWNNKASLVIPAVSVGWAALFVRELVAERGRWIVSWLLLAVVAYSMLLGLGFLMFGRESFYRAPSVYAAPVLAVILGVLAGFARRRPKVGLWVLTGMTVLVAGAMLPLMRNLGWLPVSFVTQYGLEIGGALEIPLALIGLYFRSRERMDIRLRLEALSHTDPLTGVKNHRFLMDRLEHLLGRSRRDPLLGAVLRVHVANLDRIRRDHGREAAEAAVVQAAQCVAREAAEGDTVAREEGGDLVLVLEGQVSQAHAAAAGLNIIARGLQFSDQLPQGVALALRVGGVCAPLPPTDAGVLLAMLRRVIADLRRDPSRRALRFIEPPLPGRTAPLSAEPAMSDS